MANSITMTTSHHPSNLVHLNAHSNSRSLSPISLPATSPYADKTMRSNRRRGVVLTQQGWQKMMQAGVLYDDFGKRYTYEELSERSLLDARTVSRILSCEVKVDKRTLKTFFRAFNLHLEAGDYTAPYQNSIEGTDQAITRQNIPHQLTQLNPVSEEVRQLKQQIMDSYDQLFNLLGLDKMSHGIPELSNLLSSRF